MFELKADDVLVWSGPAYPTQWIIDRVAQAGDALGWNGTALDLYRDGTWVAEVRPSEGVLG